MKTNKNFDKFIKFMLAPPTTFMVFVWGFSILIITSAIVLVCLNVYGIISYFIYSLAFLFLSYSTYLIVKSYPKLKKALIKQCKKFQFTRSVLENYGFRTFVFAIFSITINFAFVIFNVIFAILTNYAWYGALAIYYLLLSSFRLCIIFTEGKTNKKYCNDSKAKTIQQLKNMRAYGIILLILETSMAVVISMMILSKNPTVYTQIMAIVYAAYTFYKITFAVLNTIKAYKSQNIEIQAFRNIGMADALISLISLQIILVATFSENNNALLPLNAVVGFFICTFTIVLGISMIVNSIKKLRKLKNN